MKSAIENFKWQPRLNYHLPVEVIATAELRKSGKHLPKAMGRYHRTEFLTLIVVISGQFQHWVDFEAVSLHEGSCLVVQPEVTQRFDLEAVWTGCLIAIRPDFFQPVSAAAYNLANLNQWVQALPARFDLNPEQLQHVAYLIRLLRSATQTMTGTPEQITTWVFHQGAALLSYLTIVADSAKPDLNAESAASHKAQAFRQLLDKHFIQHREVAWYAEQLFCTPKTLTRATNEYYGQAPKQLLLQRLALECKRLLVHTALSSSEIAQSLAFDDLSNFTKFFKRETGLTPLEFRAVN